MRTHHYSDSRSSDDSNEEYAMLPNADSSTLRHRRWEQKLISPRKLKFVWIAAITLVVLVGLGSLAMSSKMATGRVEPTLFPTNNTNPISTSSSELDLLDPSLNLNGPPTTRFRDNLRPELKYITSWLSAGWTNDVMTYINLVYLAIITDSIPIIPMFIPSHIGGDKPNIDFGEVFDVKRLAQSINRPVLEWHQVKDRNNGEVDELGCWNTWEAVQEREKFPRRSVVPDILKLDISYTKAPAWIKVIPNYVHDVHAYFWALAALAFPETRQENLVTPLESPQHHVSLPPDEQLLCYDYLYYVCALQPSEFEFDYSPAWRYAGQYMRWTERLEKIADEYIRTTTDTLSSSEAPPYIGIHIRHGDFKNYCGEQSSAECFAPISAIAKRIEEVKAELQETRGITVEHVIMTSDERDESWWDQVVAQGWYRVDHSTTAQNYGHWYPVLIDAVIQSNGVGFVGTDRSTMSIIARRRVQSWHNGVVRTLKWGKPSADIH